MENSLVQEAQEARHMAVIVSEAKFIGLLVGIGFCERGLVFIVVMAEVLCGFLLLMATILSDHGPGYLER